MSDLLSADINLIRRVIPHRYPFLMVDRVRDIDGTKSAVGIKNVTANEPYFEGHFPAEPVMPGVLMVEAMAQTAGIMVGVAEGLEDRNFRVYFMGVDNAKFRRKVVPGDVLELRIVTKRGGGRVWKFSGRAEVNGELACEADFTAMLERPA